MQFSQNIDGVRQNDSQGFNTHTSSIYKQNPIEQFFIFTIYQNPTLALTHSEWRPQNIYSQEEINL